MPGKFDGASPFEDKLHEECGVAAIYGHPEASKLTYLSLYALQHRGQESAGISTSDGTLIHTCKSMGHVADIFTEPVLAGLPGTLAIGHTRYSTTGDTVERNAQPFSVHCNKGRIAVAHNGNITNAAELRADLEARGSIFQASSDTEVILHLVAHSRETNPGRRAPRCFAAARRRIFTGISGPGPRHRGARSAGLPSARHGATRIQRRRPGVCFCDYENEHGDEHGHLHGHDHGAHHAGGLEHGHAPASDPPSDAARTASLY